MVILEAVVCGAVVYCTERVVFIFQPILVDITEVDKIIATPASVTQHKT